MRRFRLEPRPRARRRVVPVAQTRRLDFRSIANRTGFANVEPIRRIVLPSTLRQTMRQKVARYNELCDEAQDIMRRVENMLFDEEMEDEIEAAVEQSMNSPLPQLEPEKIPDGVIIDYTFRGTEEHNECSICLNDFRVNETLSILPCGHLFHRDCIACWVCDHPSCPVCRMKLV